MTYTVNKLVKLSKEELVSYFEQMIENLKKHFPKNQGDKLINRSNPSRMKKSVLVKMTKM